MSSEPSEEHPGMTQAQHWHYYKRYPYLLAKAALWAGVLGIIYWLMRNVEAVLFPVLVSLLLAYLLDPAVDRLEAACDRIDAFRRAGASRTMAIIVFMAAIALGVVGFILILYPALAKQVATVVKRAPELAALAQESVLPWIAEVSGQEIPETVSEAFEEYGGAVREQIPNVMKRVSSVTASVLAQTGTVVASLLNLVMIPVFTFYFLRDFDIYTAKLRDYVPLSRREFYLDRISKMDEVVGAWFRGQVTVALVLAALYSLGLAIVFGIAGVGVGTGIAIGVMSGLLNIIPYFGFLIGFILSMLMVLLDWSGFGPVIGVGIVFGIVQGLEGWVITPKIVGDKVGLSPVVVIIVLLLGGEMFGLLGVLLALPVAGIARALLPDFIAYYKASPFYSGRYGPDDDDVVPQTFAPGPGLHEETDGDLDIDEPLFDPPSEPVDLDAVRRPVTAEHVSVDDRTSAPSPLDAGTDADAEASSDAVTKPPASPPPLSLRRPTPVADQEE